MPVTSPPAGPVEWVAITFPGSGLGPEVTAPLAGLVDAKTVRVLDAVVVRKAADGTISEVEIDAGAPAFDQVDGEVLELLNHDDLLAIAGRLARRHDDPGGGLGESVGGGLRGGGARPRRVRDRPRPRRARGRRRGSRGAGRRGRGDRAGGEPGMRRRLGRGRGGPGLLGTVARTAVIAGTASAVAGRVDAAQQSAAQQQQQAAAAQEQLRQMQLQAQIDAQVDARMAGDAARAGTHVRAALGRRAARPAHQARRAAAGGPAHRRRVRRAEGPAARMTDATGAETPGPPPPGQPRRVAIACQGGGSHTAFTAGVLSRLFDGPGPAGYEVVGLSGTSGGAVCALMAWTALRDDDQHKARALLDGFWGDNSASTPLDAAVNVWLLWASTLQSTGFLPTVSPYDLPSTGLRPLPRPARPAGRLRPHRRRPARRAPLLLSAPSTCCPGSSAPSTAAATGSSPTCPRLRRDPDGVPGGAHPRRHLLGRPVLPEPAGARAARNQAGRALGDPDQPDGPRGRAETVLDIADRRNELSGNLSLYQELHGIEMIDQLLAEGLLVGDRYKQVTVRVLEFSRPLSSRLLGPASKLNRDPRFLRELMAPGRAAGRGVPRDPGVRAGVAVGRDLDAILADPRPGRRADLHRAVPAARRPARRARARRGRRPVPRVRMDLTRKQLTRERATWTVRLEGEADRAAGWRPRSSTMS